MKIRFTTVLTLCALLFGFAVTARAGDMDPLLKLLVDKGVITMEQALSVQAEYDRQAKQKDCGRDHEFFRVIDGDTGLAGIIRAP